MSPPNNGHDNYTTRTKLTLTYELCYHVVLRIAITMSIYFRTKKKKSRLFNFMARIAILNPNIGRELTERENRGQDHILNLIKL